MGLTEEYLAYIYESVNCFFGGRKMLELGNQFIMCNHPEKTGHEYYTNRGADHISIDLYDKEATYQFDLTKPFPPTWHGYFDIITNSGTTEHVEPKDGQYQSFKNIHDCLKVGGIAVHIIPSIKYLKETGAWEGHCNYFYSEDFVDMLIQERIGYKLLSLKYINNLICFAIQKMNDKPFMTDKAKFLRYIDERRIQ
jgi:hypothetical protein